MPQGERDGVDNIGGRKQVTTVGFDSKGGGEGGVDSKAEKGKGRMSVATITKETIAVAVKKITLNS